MKNKYKLLFIPIILLMNFFSIDGYSQNGIIRGKVVNAINNEPIPFANVSIQGTTIGATSDINGTYELKNMKPGTYNIQATFVGFETYTALEIEVSNSKPYIMDIPLKETAVKLKEVEVKTDAFLKREESPISMRTIGISEISRNPGGNRDISKVIQSLPGVAPSVSYRNDLVVRGGAPNENRFYIDDIEVPNINHFATQGSSGGPVGLINVDFVRDVSFYSSAFPANRGNALSSVMDFKFKEGRTDRLGGKFTLGASDIGATLEGPAGKDASFMISARRSYLQFLFKMIGLPFLPTYNDFTLKYKWKINQKNEITFIGLGAIDEFTLNTTLQENGTDQQKYILGYLPVSSQWNYINGLKYINYGHNGYTTMVVSRNMLNNQAFKYRNNDESTKANLILKYKSQEIENKFRVERTSNIKGFKLTFGTNLENAKYTNATYNVISTPVGLDTISFSSALGVNKWGLHGQISKSFFNNRIGLSFGIRADANDYNKSMMNLANQLSPRFSLSVNITPEFSFNANTGIYYQLPPYTVLGYRNSQGALLNKENNITYIRSKHIVAGFEYVTKNNLKISTEGFLKYFDHYPFLVREQISLANLGSDFGVIGNSEVTSVSVGRSYGVELLAQQKLFMGFYGLMTYTYVRSEFEDKNGKYVPSAWDNIHIFNITFGKSFKHNWEVGAKWRFALGAPYTPFDIHNSVLRYNWDVNHQGIVDYSKLNTERLPATHFLDFRIDKKIYLKYFNLNLYLDVQNAYNFQTMYTPILNVLNDDTGKPMIEDPSLPYNQQTYKYKVLENKSGTVLPTIGIVIEF